MNLIKDHLFFAAIALSIGTVFSFPTVVIAASLSRSMDTPRVIDTDRGIKKIEANHLLVKFKPDRSPQIEDQILERHKTAKVEVLSQGRMGSIHRVRGAARTRTENIN